MQTSPRNLEAEFPIKKNTAYFNNASYTPMSTSAINSILVALRGYSTSGPSDEYYRELKDGANSCRQKLSKMIDSAVESIVFTESATQSINFVANGLKLEKGDSIVTRGGVSEHPSNYLPWKYYSEVRGVKIKDLATDRFGIPPLSELDSVLKETKAKLVVMSHVLYNLGTIMPVREISKIAHERGALFFLDAAQSVGNVKVDVKEVECDFLAGTAAKWLCGPLGLGFFYCSQGALQTLEPLNFGANACTLTPEGKYETFTSPARLQEGFRNWAYTYGLEGAIDLWNEFGQERIRERNLKLTDLIIDEISSTPERFTFLGTNDDDLRTSIIPVASAGPKCSEVVQKLAKKGIVIAEREVRERKILRISPHFYNDENEVERLVQVMREI